jgi:hypothetical protein
MLNCRLQIASPCLPTTHHSRCGWKDRDNNLLYGATVPTRRVTPIPLCQKVTASKQTQVDGRGTSMHTSTASYTCRCCRARTTCPSPAPPSGNEGLRGPWSGRVKNGSRKNSHRGNRNHPSISLAREKAAFRNTDASLASASPAGTPAWPRSSMKIVQETVAFF